MAGYVVPEIWCDECHDRELAESETTLTELRETLHGVGWHTHQKRSVPRRLHIHPDQGLFDFHKDCCPVCEEQDA